LKTERERERERERELDCMSSLVGNYFSKVIHEKTFPYTPWRRLVGEKVQLQLILDRDTRWGEWLASRLGRVLPPAKVPPVPTGQEAGWAPEPL
jgi:hypothetical protein